MDQDTSLGLKLNSSTPSHQNPILQLHDLSQGWVLTTFPPLSFHFQVAIYPLSISLKSLSKSVSSFLFPVLLMWSILETDQTGLRHWVLFIHVSSRTNKVWNMWQGLGGFGELLSNFIAPMVPFPYSFRILPFQSIMHTSRRHTFLKDTSLGKHWGFSSAA